MFASHLKKTVAALSLALLAGAAHAAPQLKGDVTVTSAIVTIGDVFEEAGLLAEAPIFRAPAPGTTGSVPIAEIAAAAQAAGLTDFETFGLDRVRVSRAGVSVDMDLLGTLIEDDLSARGILSSAMTMQIALDEPLPLLTSGNPEAPAALSILRYMPGSSSFSARFEIGGRDRPLDINGQIQIMIDAPHLARSLPAGTILGANDIEMRMVPLPFAENAGIARAEELVGKQLQRQIRAGVIVRPNDVSAPELISRNETVTVVYQHGALTLTTRGQALNAASRDQPVSVLNTMTKKVVHGRAINDGIVLITSGNQQLAGI